MATQGASEVLKKVSQNVKMKTPRPLNANPRSSKGPAAEGVALEITDLGKAHWHLSKRTMFCIDRKMNRSVNG